MERVVRLYGRAGCTLCDEARAMLTKIQERLKFEIEDVDIESDTGLHDRFFLEIPVVEVAGEVVAQAPLSERILRVALEDAFETGD